MTYPRLIALGLAAALSATVAVAQTGGAGSIRVACAADIQKACPDAKPGPTGGMRECVKGHYSEFTPTCQSAIQAMRARMQAARAAQAAATPATNSP